MTLRVTTTLESWENGGRQQRNAIPYAVQLHAHSIKWTGCIQMPPLPAPRYGSNTAVCVAWVVSTRRAINSITGFTFWKPITGWKTVYRFSDYRFNISTHYCYLVLLSQSFYYPTDGRRQSQTVEKCAISHDRESFKKFLDTHPEVDDLHINGQQWNGYDVKLCDHEVTDTNPDCCISCMKPRFQIVVSVTTVSVANP